MYVILQSVFDTFIKKIDELYKQMSLAIDSEVGENIFR